jgi:hypothetical protein
MLIRPEQTVSTKGKKVVLSSEISSDLFYDKIKKPSKVVSQKRKWIGSLKLAKILRVSPKHLSRALRNQKSRR